MQIWEFSGEEFEDVARQIYTPVIARTGPGFRGRAEVQELGETLTLSRSHFRGQISVVPTGRTAARASVDNLLHFSVWQMADQGHVRQHDRLAGMAAGSGILHEARSRYERASLTERCLNLRFPRELLPLRTSEITEACARNVDASAPAMQMLSTYLGRLFDAADDLTGPQRLDAGRAAIDLLAMALRDATPSVPGGDGPEQVLLDMMRTHVRTHLADPQLRVAELARRHHISVRYAYSLFERIGTTPGAYLREQRLLAAQVMLIDPRHHRLTMSSIAGAVGFLDLSTFERAFRRKYGMTPAGWRREYLFSGSLPLTCYRKRTQPDGIDQPR
ncbi:helix-turn-helix domain-containing protein [Pseudonocardia sp. CA-142604]|uniref:helix-turn-helix domain-containing protein n=1 Tax=Pseudonocardia sp. CA-142604 TaxID=3240024 RepID=UPI003D91B24C